MLRKIMNHIPSLSALYLEDLQPGMCFLTASHVLDEQQIIVFAQQFDPQPFHTDPVAARGTLFKGLVASGWHTAAITMKLIVESLPIAGGVVGAGGEADWPQPSRPDDVLHVEGQITEIRPSRTKHDRGIVTISTRTLTQKNEVVQNLTAKLVVFRRTVMV
jgi:acyl dehydratase